MYCVFKIDTSGGFYCDGCKKYQITNEKRICEPVEEIKIQSNDNVKKTCCREKKKLK
mgnify:CR=1 FL=1